MKCSLKHFSSHLLTRRSFFLPLHTRSKPPHPHSSVRSAQFPPLMGAKLRRLPPCFRHPPSFTSATHSLSPPLLSFQTSSVTPWRLHPQQQTRSFGCTNTHTHSGGHVTARCHGDAFNHFQTNAEHSRNIFSLTKYLKMFFRICS